MENYIIYGKKCSGKTEKVKELISNINTDEKIIIFSLLENCTQHFINYTNYKNKNNVYIYTNLEFIPEDILYNLFFKKIIIFDDIIFDDIFKNEKLKNLLFNHKHYNCNFIITSQYITKNNKIINEYFNVLTPSENYIWNTESIRNIERDFNSFINSKRQNMISN